MIEFIRGIRTPLRTHPVSGRGEIPASKPSMEAGVAVVQHELDIGVGLIEVHVQVPGLLHYPLAAGLGGGAQDPGPGGWPRFSIAAST